jgi:hypothetical protein
MRGFRHKKPRAPALLLGSIHLRKVTANGIDSPFDAAYGFCEGAPQPFVAPSRVRAEQFLRDLLSSPLERVPANTLRRSVRLIPRAGRHDERATFPRRTKRDPVTDEAYGSPIDVGDSGALDARSPTCLVRRRRSAHRFAKLRPKPGLDEADTVAICDEHAHRLSGDSDLKKGHFTRTDTPHCEPLYLAT